MFGCNALAHSRFCRQGLELMQYLLQYTTTRFFCLPFRHQISLYACVSHLKWDFEAGNDVRGRTHAPSGICTLVHAKRQTDPMLFRVFCFLTTLLLQMCSFVILKKLDHFIFMLAMRSRRCRLRISYGHCLLDKLMHHVVTTPRNMQYQGDSIVRRWNACANQSIKRREKSHTLLYSVSPPGLTAQCDNLGI